MTGQQHPEAGAGQDWRQSVTCPEPLLPGELLGPPWGQHRPGKEVLELVR